MLLLLLACNVMPIEDGAVFGPLTQIDDGFTSFFLLEHSGGVVLFDTGGSDKGKRLLPALEERGWTAEDVTDVFLTHGHGDHLGGLAALPAPTVHAFAADQALLDTEGPVALDPEPLTDGQVFSFDGVEVETLAAPGHTPGNTTFRVDRVLVMGDTAVATRSGEVRPPPRFFSEDADQAEQALADLGAELADRADDFDWTVFAHSGAVEGLDALLAYEVE